MESRIRVKLPGGAWMVTFLGAVIGAALFLHTYGSAVLDTTNDAWIFRIKDVDIHQHYLGWCSFRNAPWSFPPGLFNSLSYPHNMSILWTDSIPLFALFFKACGSDLPDTFQYFGMFGIISQALTGAMAALLMRKVTENDIIAVFSVPFYAGSFPILQRMFYHTSLTAHYLIIIPLLYIVYDGCKWKEGGKCAFWGTYSFISVMIHPYLFIMGMVIAVISFIYEIVKTKRIWPAGITGIVSLVSTYTAMVMMGVLSGPANLGYKLGGFNANLNTFFNPMKLGDLLPGLPIYTSGQYEGYSYLGAGGLLLVAFGFVLFVIKQVKRINTGEKFYVEEKAVVLFIIFITFFLMSVLPDLSYNTKLIFSLKIPDVLQSVIGIYRSNGRFIWPCYILVFTAAISVIADIHINTGSRRRMIPALFLICFCFCFQIADMEKTMSENYMTFNKKYKYWHSDLEDEESFSNHLGYEHIVLVTPDSYTMERSAYFAIKNGLTLNRFYFARDIESTVEEDLEKYHAACRKGNAPPDVIFVFDEKTMEEWRKDTKLHFYDISGTIVGVAKPLERREIGG